MLQPQQLTGLSERKRSTGGKNSEAFRALGWTADGENRSLVCVRVDFFYYGDQNMLALLCNTWKQNHGSGVVCLR